MKTASRYSHNVRGARRDGGLPGGIISPSGEAPVGKQSKIVAKTGAHSSDVGEASRDGCLPRRVVSPRDDLPFRCQSKGMPEARLQSHKLPDEVWNINLAHIVRAEADY